MIVKMRTLRILPFFLLLLLYSATAVCAQNRSSISGFVTDTDRRPVGQVIVELRLDFSTIGRQRTDNSGKYYFAGLALGRYTIRVLPLGTPFEEQSEEVELTGLGSRGQQVPDNQQKDIYLRRRKTAAAVAQPAVIYAQEIPKNAEALYKDAISDLDGQRVANGSASLEKAIEAFPTYFMALYRLGMVRVVQEKYGEAAPLFERALAVNERSFESWYGLAFSRYSLKNYPEAVKAAERAIAEKPNSAEAYLVLGIAQRMTREFDKAEAAFKQAMKTAGGGAPDVHWQLALLYGKDMDRFADAAKELEAFLKIEPDAPNKEDIKKLIKQFRDKEKSKVKT